MSIVHVVNKDHMDAQVLGCQLPYSLTLLPGGRVGPKVMGVEMLFLLLIGGSTAAHVA